LRNPLISTIAIWIWIVNSANRLAQAKEYATHSLRNYSILEAKYIPVKNECLYDLTICKQSPNVFLTFFIKNEEVEVEGMKLKIRSSTAPPISLTIQNTVFVTLRVWLGPKLILPLWNLQRGMTTCSVL
jgi:hypothetical protein